VQRQGEQREAVLDRVERQQDLRLGARRLVAARHFRVVAHPDVPVRTRLLTLTLGSALASADSHACRMYLPTMPSANLDALVLNQITAET
jgi:hypothetical protein